MNPNKDSNKGSRHYNPKKGGQADQSQGSLSAKTFLIMSYFDKSIQDQLSHVKILLDMKKDQITFEDNDGNNASQDKAVVEIIKKGRNQERNSKEIFVGKPEAQIDSFKTVGIVRTCLENHKAKIMHHNNIFPVFGHFKKQPNFTINGLFQREEKSYVIFDIDCKRQDLDDLETELNKKLMQLTRSDIAVVSNPNWKTHPSVEYVEAMVKEVLDVAKKKVFMEYQIDQDSILFSLGTFHHQNLLEEVREKLEAFCDKDPDMSKVSQSSNSSNNANSSSGNNNNSNSANSGNNQNTDTTKPNTTSSFQPLHKSSGGFVVSQKQDSSNASTKSDNRDYRDTVYHKSKDGQHKSGNSGTSYQKSGGGDKDYYYNKGKGKDYNNNNNNSGKEETKSSDMMSSINLSCFQDIFFKHFILPQIKKDPIVSKGNIEHFIIEQDFKPEDLPNPRFKYSTFRVTGNKEAEAKVGEYIQKVFDMKVKDVTIKYKVHPKTMQEFNKQILRKKLVSICQNLSERECEIQITAPALTDSECKVWVIHDRRARFENVTTAIQRTKSLINRLDEVIIKSNFLAFDEAFKDKTNQTLHEYAKEKELIVINLPNHGKIVVAGTSQNIDTFRKIIDGIEGAPKNIDVEEETTQDTQNTSNTNSTNSGNTNNSNKAQSKYPFQATIRVGSFQIRKELMEQADKIESKFDGKITLEGNSVQIAGLNKDIVNDMKKECQSLISSINASIQTVQVDLSEQQWDQINRLGFAHFREHYNLEIEIVDHSVQHKEIEKPEFDHAWEFNEVFYNFSQVHNKQILDGDQQNLDNVQLISPLVIPDHDQGENLIFNLDTQEITFVMNGNSKSQYMKSKGNQFYQVFEDDQNEEAQKIPQDLTEAVLEAQAQTGQDRIRVFYGNYMIDLQGGFLVNMDMQNQQYPIKRIVVDPEDRITKFEINQYILNVTGSEKHIKSLLELTGASHHNIL